MSLHLWDKQTSAHRHVRWTAVHQPLLLPHHGQLTTAQILPITRRTKDTDSFSFHLAAVICPSNLHKRMDCHCNMSSGISRCWEVQAKSHSNLHAGCPTCWCDAGELRWIVADAEAGLWLLTCHPEQSQPLHMAKLTATAPLTIANCLTMLPDWQLSSIDGTTSGKDN